MMQKVLTPIFNKILRMMRRYSLTIRISSQGRRSGGREGCCGDEKTERTVHSASRIGGYPRGGLFHENFLNIVALHADEDAVGGVVDAHALEIIVNSGGELDCFYAFDA